MNVANRKLFTNRDARAKLSSMGGIMASSPELLGEVQKFKTGTRNGEVVEANSMLSRILNPYLTPKQRNNFIGRAIAGEYGLEVQKDTMNSALAGTFGENVRAKAESLKPILSGYGLGSESEDGLGSIDITEAFDNLEVDQAPELLQGVTPPFVQETSPVLSQPSVQPNTFSSESMINEQAPRSTGPEFSPLARLAPRLFGDVVPSGMPLVEGPGPAPAFPMNTAADSTDPLGVLTNPRTGDPMTLLPPGERSPQALAPRSGLRTLLDKAPKGSGLRTLLDRFTPEQDPRVATESPGFLDSDAGQEISPEVAQELKMLEDLRAAQSINAPQGTLEGLKTVGADLLEVGNIAMGFPMYVGGQAVAGAADAAGYLGGGGNFSRAMFGFSDDMQDKTNELFLPEGTPGGVPRLYSPDPDSAYSQRLNPLTMDALNQLSSEELAAQRALIRAESEAAIENADASVFSEGAPTELTPAGRAQRAADSVTRMSEQGMPKGLSPEAIERIQEQQAQETIDRELDAAGQRLVAGQPIEAGPFVPSEETVTEERTTEGQTVNSAGQLVDADGNYVPIEENLEVMPGDLIAASGGGQEEVVETDNSELAILARENASENARVRDAAGITRSLTEEERTARLAEAKEDRALRAADSTTRMSEQGPNIVFDPTKIQEEIEKGGSGSDSIIGGVTGTNQNLTPKESVKAYQAIFKEMMGIDDEDKEKEKYHQMAMIGFAIAAGQDPNALSNVAGGLLEGTKLARKDRKDKKALMSKVNMAAFDAARQDTRDAAKYTQQLDLADATRKNRLDDNFLRDFRVQKNAHLKSMGDTKVLGKVSDPQKMSRDAAQLAFQDMYQMYGKDSLLNSSLYATNKEDINMAIGAVDAGQKYLIGS